MLKKSRLYFSAMLSALVLASLLMTAGVKACEEEPQTFLSLYMNSDLVAIARYDSETEPKKTDENEYNYTFETRRKLVFTKIFKGPKGLKSISLAYSRYVPKTTENAPETEESIPEYEEYFDYSKIKIGGEYLFFLTKDKETGEYSVTDNSSGVKEIDKHLALYEKNMGELERIVAAKENQSALLTEWIVRSIENQDARDDGISDLAESFYGLNWQEEDEKFKGKGPFVINEEGFGIYTVGVAKRLTQLQRDRVSAVLYQVLRDAWFAETPEYATHGISAILGGINRKRLASFAYDSMQSIGKNDVERRRIIGEFLYDMSYDEEFNNLNNEVIDLETQIAESKSDDTPEGKEQLKELTLQRDAKLRELDVRFRFLLDRNFMPVENKEA